MQSSDYLAPNSTGDIVRGLVPARNALALGGGYHIKLNTLDALLLSDGPRPGDPPYLTVIYGELRGLRGNKASQARDIKRAKSIWSDWKKRQA